MNDALDRVTNALRHEMERPGGGWSPRDMAIAAIKAFTAPDGPPAMFTAICPDCRAQMPRGYDANGCRRCDGTGYIDRATSAVILPKRKLLPQRGYYFDPYSNTRRRGL